MNEIRVIPAELIEKTVHDLCIAANLHLPKDVEEALHAAAEEETWKPARESLELLQQNCRIAAEKSLPICQDTGAACVFLEIGINAHISGDVCAAVNEGVRKGYADGYLRKSIVSDPILRRNTDDNTPAFLSVEPVPGDRVKVTVAPKGFGSENMSALKMLKPSDGAEGVMDFVLDTVKKAGPNPCPPVILGIGIGGTFDKAAFLAKKALLRPLNVRNADAYYAELEEKLKERINGLGIGPQGFGGKTSCLGVSIEKFPTHIAGLPVAVNVSCHATRRASVLL